MRCVQIANTGGLLYVESRRLCGIVKTLIQPSKNVDLTFLPKALLRSLLDAVSVSSGVVHITLIACRGWVYRTL